MSESLVLVPHCAVAPCPSENNTVSSVIVQPHMQCLHGCLKWLCIFGIALWTALHLVINLLMDVKWLCIFSMPLGIMLHLVINVWMDVKWQWAFGTTLWITLHPVISLRWHLTVAVGIPPFR